MAINFFSDLYIKAALPIDSRLYADTFNDLLTKVTTYNFENMVVFVKDVKKFYYLAAGTTGANAGDWQEWMGGGGTSARFIPYVPAQPYTEIGMCVSVGTRMFISTSDTISGSEDPINTPSKWLEVSGANYVEFIGTNVTEVTIAHNIDYPAVYAYIGDQRVYPSEVYNTNEVVVTFSEEIPSVKIVVK